MPKAVKEEKKFAPYEWAENTLKLAHARKFVADRVANNQITIADETEREAAVKARYLELAGHITGDKLVRPRRKDPMFGGQPTMDDEDDDDE